MAKISVDTVESNDHSAPAERTSRSKRTIHRQHLLIGLFVVSLLAVCGYMIFDRMRLSNEVEELSKSQKQQTTAEDEAKQLAGDVAKLIDLPTDETPTVATVTDAVKVADKPFFAKAHNGDKVLLYAKSGKAVLYRPSAKKLIEVSTLNLSEAQPSGATTKKP